MRNYKEHFVAFLDILGFKNIIENASCEEIYEIFNDIHSKSKAQMIYNGIKIEAYEHIKHKVLSDSVVLYIDAEIEDGFAVLLDICSRLQSTLICRENPILLRGGISKGLLHCEDDIIYGKGLTSAYLLENNLAKYPRIIFTKATLEEGKNISKYIYLESVFTTMNKFREDEDHLYFVKYCPPINLPLYETKENFDRLFNLCENVFNNKIDVSIREKYLWLYNYLNKSVSEIDQIKQMYDKEKIEEQERKLAEMDNNFGNYGKSNPKNSCN